MKIYRYKFYGKNNSMVSVYEPFTKKENGLSCTVEEFRELFDPIDSCNCRMKS